MNQSSPSEHSACALFLTVGMITCLILLVTVSFKIVLLEGMVFSVSSLLCPLIAGLYLLVLRKCTFKEQRHLLNLTLMSLYIFCIGVYLLVNLPAAEFMHNNPVYQIIFEDIPKKFFATSMAFALSFYLPHFLFCTRTNKVLASPKKCMLLAMFGGLAFSSLDFALLFSDPQAHSFKQIFIDSFMVSSFLLLIIGVSYLLFVLDDVTDKPSEVSMSQTAFPVYHYLLCFAVAITLMCLACEYRIVSFTQNSILAASCLFFPITMGISTLIGEVWGYRANLKLAVVLILAQLIFDTFLIGIAALPSPPFFNLNPFYNFILPRRLPASSMALLVTFVSSAMLIHYLKKARWNITRPFRIIITNICAGSILCLVDYSLLYGGIYPYEQIVDLAVSVWQYKVVMTFVSLPALLRLCQSLEANYKSGLSLS